VHHSEGHVGLEQVQDINSMDAADIAAAHEERKVPVASAALAAFVVAVG
jgi:hypothetical protein